MNLKRYQTAQGTCWLLRQGQRSVAKLGPCSHAEALKYLKQAERAYRRQEASRALGDVEQITVQEYVEIYRKRYLRHKAPRTQQEEKKVQDRFVKVYGSQLLDRITKANLEDYKAARSEVLTREERPLAPTTVNIDIRYLKVIFSKAVEDGYLSVSPAGRLFKQLRVDRPVIPEVKWANISRLLLAAQRRPLVMIYALVTLKCGLRPSETLRLTVEDVAESGDYLRIRSTPVNPAKSRSERLVPLASDARAWLEWLAMWWVQPRNGKIVKRDPKTQPYLFCHANGKPVKSFRHGLRDLSEGLGMKRMTPAVFRKVFSSALGEEDVHPEKVRLATGHATIDVLLKYYTTVGLKVISKAINKWPKVGLPPARGGADGGRVAGDAKE
jgi:integrase